MAKGKALSIAIHVRFRGAGQGRITAISGRVRKGCCSCSIILSGHCQRSGATWAHAANIAVVRQPLYHAWNLPFVHVYSEGGIALLAIRL